jgi:hypothetical protein
MEKYFFGFTVKDIPIEQNNEADMLAKVAAQKEPLLPDAFYEVLKCKSVDCDKAPVRYINVISSEDWRSSIMAFPRGHYKPQAKEESKRMALRARAYEIRGDNLYKRGVCAPLLKCISIEEGRDLLQQIHSGMCSSHIGTRRLVAKAFRQGFY